MSQWTRVTLVIPAEYKDAANRLAAIFDFDTGGGKTFGADALSPTGEEPATHYLANTPIKSNYIAALTDPASAFSTLSFLASKYRRDPPSQQDVDDWCANLIMGEPEGLIRIGLTEAP